MFTNCLPLLTKQKKPVEEGFWYFIAKNSRQVFSLHKVPDYKKQAASRPSV